MVKRTDVFKILNDVVLNIKTNEYYKIEKVTRDGVTVIDYADNGVEINVTINWKQIKG